MSEGTEEQRTHIITHLERLNKNVEKQMSISYGLRNGIIYGLGFVVGSTLLSALVVTVVLQFFGDTLFADVVHWIVWALR